MRRLVVMVVASAGVVTATPAWAAGCSAAYDLLPIEATLDRVDQRIYDTAEWVMIQDLVASLDANGDKLLCSKQLKPNQGRDKQWVGPEDGPVTDYIVTAVYDNKVQGR